MFLECSRFHSTCKKNTISLVLQVVLFALLSLHCVLFQFFQRICTFYGICTSVHSPVIVCFVCGVDESLDCNYCFQDEAERQTSLSGSFDMPNLEPFRDMNKWSVAIPYVEPRRDPVNGTLAISMVLSFLKKRLNASR